ncbi:MAG TPA: PAS domain S-box protein [Chitinispirillaceae bacterium]|nr:PAS domain S-box protein [Chitinispirillaceae bacterium]
MLVFSSFSIMAAILCFSLAIIVLRYSSHNVSNRFFGIFCLSESFWAFTDFLAAQSETAQKAAFWFDFGAIWALCITFFLHFILAYTTFMEKKLFKYLLVITYFIATVFAFLDYSVINNSVEWNNWGWRYTTQPSLLFLIESIWAVLILLLCVLLLTYFHFNSKTESIRSQSLIILTGSAVAAIIGIAGELIVPTFFTNIPDFSKASICVIAVFVTYAVRHHNLFHLNPSDAADIIIRSMSDALFVVNIRDEIVIVNKALLNLLQYTKSELLGKHPDIIVSFIASTDTTVKQLLSGGSVNDIQTDFIKKDGTKIPISLSWSILSYKNQTLRGIVFLGRDISEQQQLLSSLQQTRDELELRVEERTKELEDRNKQLQFEIQERILAEKDLAEQKEYLSVTLRSIGDGVITVDENESVVLLNKAAEAITGWDHTDAAGKKLSDVFQIKYMEKNATSSYSTNSVSDIGNNKAQLQSLSGVNHILSENRSAIFDSTGNTIGYVIVFRDITERELLEEELFKSRKLESVSLLASGLAHDFNNLLTGIITNLFMAKIALPLDSEANNMITNAEKSAFRASSLTKQLLSFARDSSIPAKEVCSLKELIEESVGFFLSGSKCDYKLDLDQQLYMVEIDRGQIDQVLNNVIVNADQSMPQGGTISVKAQNMELQKNAIFPLKAGKYVCISITDEGVGISAENIHKIFDPYFTTRQHGNGLGLSSAYSIVQKHNGHITVQSELNKGSTFSIFLPASNSSYSDVVVSPEDTINGRGKILVLDDDDIIRRSTERLLSHLGYKVFMASEGDQALQLYTTAIKNECPFDVAILDLTIPGGKGAQEIIGDLCKIDPHTKAIVSSGYPDDPVMINFSKFGFCAAISKPYNIEELSGLIKKIITLPEN